MGDGLARAFLEILGVLGKLSLASVAGGCVMVLVPMLFLWPRFDQNTGTRPLARIALIVLIAIIGGLFLMRLLTDLLL